jgi:glycosyltransferase involved in cell wall biosynthesis
MKIKSDYMTIYYDYSSIKDWKGFPTGIPRTVLEIARNFNNDIKLICIDDTLNQFYHYDITNNIILDCVEFEESDILISPGATWAYACYLNEVKRISSIGVRYFQIFYDLIPGLFPFLYEHPGFGPHYKKIILEMINYCTESFAISESTKNDIERYCKEENIKYNPINVIRLGDDISREKTHIEKVKEDIKDLRNYILTVGSIEYRKNHITLLNAYRLLLSEGKTDLPVLVIVGREGFLNNMIVYQVENDPLLKNRVKVFSDVSDDDLDYLYRNCMFTLYPAHYEGWGLPIAESLMYGKQCICSNTSSMIEIAPNITRFAHPLKTTEWAENIYDLYSNKDKLEAETKKVIDEYKGTHWSETAQQLIDFIRQYENKGKK